VALVEPHGHRAPPAGEVFESVMNRSNAPMAANLCRPLKTQRAQARMVVGTPPERPAIQALVGLDRQIVDARQAAPHETRFCEFPILISVASKPIARIVMAFIGEAHSDSIVAEGPELL